MECGAEVNIINRKRLLHAKCYGTFSEGNQRAVVSSGNFTGPGLSLNVEASIYLENEELLGAGFSWNEIEEQLLAQQWQIIQGDLTNADAPCWRLLYDETPGVTKLDEADLETMLITLMPTDTNRIMADKGDDSGKGSQYFWLSKDCFDFFPPLTIKNKKGWKGTLSTLVNMNYVDLGITKKERVTFEAENNLDFRLGTGGLRYSKLAQPDDLACLTRLGDEDYELRIINQQDARYGPLEKFAQTFIGHQGKRYGYIENKRFFSLIT